MKAIWESSPVRFVREVAFVYFDRNVSRSAAELTYFLVLSFFPLLICVNALIGQLNLDVNMAMDTAAAVIPKESLEILGDYISYITENQSPGLLLTGIGMTIVSASAAVRSLMSVMEEIYEQRCVRGLCRVLASIGFSVILLVTIYASMALIITGGWFFRMLEQFLMVDIFVGEWPRMRFLLLLGLLFLFILLIYRAILPPSKPRPAVLPGAAFSALVLVGASILFSWFMGESTRYSLVYGSLASVIILLVWMYLCGNIIILGNVLNYVRYQRRLEREGRA
ncbi:MAG: YihY/virulence factor BrkB family protein [Clostridiales bacterium]|nr:YihY/virulence factor BrkB family protein [Clostridiales bacterium]